jgi:modulator of FtsH protease
LTGLLFVALSLNLKQILEYPNLPRWAACTLGILVALLLTGTCALAPGLSAGALGAPSWSSASPPPARPCTCSAAAGASRARPTNYRVTEMSILLLPGVLLALGGLSVATTTGGGLYWVLAAFVSGFVGSVVNAWVFLVETQR